MQTLPSLSIVIPAKNEERYLPILLDGLDTQTYRPQQIILADAQSTDKTRELALARGCLVVEGGMPGPGRNAGAKLATGEVILFLDADVRIMDPKFLERALREMTEKQLAIATVDIELVNGKPLDKLAHAFYNYYVRMWGSLRPHAPGFCIFIQRSLFEKIGGFDPSIYLAEDHELAARAAKLGKFGFLSGVTVGVTDRRLRRDGGFKVAIKYILAEFHMVFLGPIRHNKFHYDFGYDEDRTKGRG